VHNQITRRHTFTPTMQRQEDYGKLGVSITASISEFGSDGKSSILLHPAYWIIGQVAKISPCLGVWSEFDSRMIRVLDRHVHVS
jgi:hypothetical protein